MRAELAKITTYDRRRIVEKFVLAALGSIPWVGGFIGAAASYKAEVTAVKDDRLQTQWLEEHARKIAELMRSLQDIVQWFERFDGRVDTRIQSEGYLGLVRCAFRVWDRADTTDKRACVSNLVSNAASAQLCSDEVLRRFVDWLDAFHEGHFAIIRQIHHNPGTTRLLIWDAVNGVLPPEDSAEAELYRLMMRDLSTGGVIVTQTSKPRDNRLPAKVRRHLGTVPAESAFDERQAYRLTALGRHFVHYTMTDAVARLAAAGLPKVETAMTAAGRRAGTFDGDGG